MIANHFRLLARSLGASLCLVAAPVLFAADAPNGDQTPQLRMSFSTNSAGETLLRYNDLTPALVKNNSNKLVNVSQLATNKGAQFSLIPDDANVQLSSEQFAGWLAEIPVKQSLRFSFDYPRSLIDLATSDLNNSPIGLTFSDGAKAQMNGNSQARLEVMNDGTYAFYGAGPINGVSADGIPVRFGNVFPPLFGGKLIAPKTTNTNARFSRATPVVQVTFLGQIDSGLRAQVGTKLVPLDRDVPQNVITENGAQISLLFNSSRRTVEWTVHRGLFRFTVDAFSCWKALGTSGQSASMQWADGMLMEIKNTSTSAAFQRTLLVNLNPTLNVAIGDSATFQYGRTGDCSTFVATAHGGDTILYNSQTGRYVRLDEGNMSIVSGTPDTIRAETQTAPKTKLRLQWNTDEQIELISVDGTVKIPINGEQTFQPGPNQDLKVTYQGVDQLTLRAENGSFALTPEVLPNITIEFGEGAGITLGLDRGTDIFRLQPIIDNNTAVGLRTPTGFYPNVQPGTRITFVINRSTFTADGDEGSLIFTETAGAGAPTVSGNLGFTPLLTGRGDVTFFNGNLSEPRVEQPPVTTAE